MGKVARLADGREFQVHLFEGGLRVFVDGRLEKGEVKELLSVSRGIVEGL